jgi:hypothetical protein
MKKNLVQTVVLFDALAVMGYVWWCSHPVRGWRCQAG